MPLTGDFALPEVPGKNEATWVQSAGPMTPFSAQVLPALAGSWLRLEPNAVK